MTFRNTTVTEKMNANDGCMRVIAQGTKLFLYHAGGCTDACMALKVVGKVNAIKSVFLGVESQELMASSLIQYHYHCAS